jgi:hypothetical protein
MFIDAITHSNIWAIVSDVSWLYLAWCSSCKAGIVEGYLSGQTRLYSLLFSAGRERKVRELDLPAEDGPDIKMGG